MHILILFQSRVFQYLRTAFHVFKLTAFIKRIDDSGDALWPDRRQRNSYLLHYVHFVTLPYGVAFFCVCDPCVGDCFATAALGVQTFATPRSNIEGQIKALEKAATKKIK